MRLASLALSLILLGSCAGMEKDAASVAAPSTDVSRLVAAAGEMCSGIAGIQCGEGLSCIYQTGVCSSIADASGTCVNAPSVCTREYMPVCGCDGETYGNKCEALAAGASVAYAGECPPTGS